MQWEKKTALICAAISSEIDVNNAYFSITTVVSFYDCVYFTMGKGLKRAIQAVNNRKYHVGYAMQVMIFFQLSVVVFINT